MPSLESIQHYLEGQPFEEFLVRMYGQDQAGSITQRERHQALLDLFDHDFPGAGSVEMCSAPGRTEIAGNHTDHENGHVLAAAVNLDALAVGARNDQPVIRIHSAGYPPMEVHLDQLEPDPRECYTSPALVRGVCSFLQKEGYPLGGFDACLTSALPIGSGLSSSAAFELLVAVLISHLYNQGRIDPLTLARAGQFAEMNFFGKPCGLMDQLTSAVGGFLSIDFREPLRPLLRQVNYDLSSSGSALVIVDPGSSHADLTEEYATVRQENRSVARLFRQEVLREVDEMEFYPALVRLRTEVGDRALLRAMHFFDEERRVIEQVAALEGGDFSRFLALVNASGRSSWMLLQNCTAGNDPRQQAIPLALSLTSRFLAKSGACRVHGGGFAGTVQVFMPQDRLAEYISLLERTFGSGSCRVVRIRPVGATRLPGNGE